MTNDQFPLVFKFLHELTAISGKNKTTFNHTLKIILERKHEDENFKNELTAFARFLLRDVNLINAYTNYGISSNRGFFQEIYSRIKNRILPAKLNKDELKAFVYKMLPSRKMLERLAWIDTSNWRLVLELVHASDFPEHEVSKIRFEMYNALVILSHRFTNIGIDPYFVQRMPEIDDVDSPFFSLNTAINESVPKTAAASAPLPEERVSDLDDKLEKCVAVLRNMEQSEKEKGTSLHQIFLTKLSFQQAERMRLLITLLSGIRNEKVKKASSQMVRTLATAAGIKNTLRRFLDQNTQLLAYRIVNHTSEKGEHYIGFTRAENKKLFISALGGGLLVVVLVYIKHLIHQFHFSLFFEGLLFGLNYAAGFITMHLLHFTLATKQPAMTASYIAATLDPEKTKSAESRKAFRQVISSQFISLIGNLIVVLPVCFLVSWFFWNYADIHIFGKEETEKALYSNHPLLSASLIYALFTAVFLSLSGIITGLVDNKIQFSEIAYRIKNHPGLVRRFSNEKLTKLAAFTEKNGGAICGNLFLGLCLGMAGNIGTFIGIPFDIRHITISAGNFGFSAASGWEISPYLAITVFFGVILIGLINVIASFLISFILACKSQGIHWKQALRILINS